ncbi:FMN-binding protein [Agitococcus lubricus]|nr:FMN-binding protein [Agitococcus lubricus]
MRYFLFLLCVLTGSSHASNVSELNVFLNKHFEQAPQSNTLWLKPNLKQRVEGILGHPYQGLRVKYWQLGTKSAWILDEIGKEQPITTGIIIEKGKISTVEVLVYRESRGGEVQQNFFTRQFVGATLLTNNKLSQRVDGITGATMSVAAMQKMAKIALLFDSEKETVIP